MKKKWRIAAVVLLAVLVGGGVLWALLQPHEPRYAGKSVSYWLGGGLSKFDTQGQVFWPMLPFPKVDSNAVPVLITALRTKDGTTRRIYNSVWHKFPIWLKKLLPVPPPDRLIRIRAIIWLQDLREQARPAIPALIQVMQNDTNSNVRAQVPQALAAIDLNDPTVRAALIEAAKDKSSSVKLEAWQVLAYPTNYAFPVRR